ncbi:hypothetical protein AGMMS50218_17090 [Actinomycetota bacterium]|nr:hypothetical protein AGMMS50218_17090 [Actinomycetota bacterium]
MTSATVFSAEGLPPTAYALLGLLMFTGRTDAGLTGYELKQRADRTLRYYWVSPAMSQVYSEMTRLVRAGLVLALESPAEPRPAVAGRRRRRTTRYVITDAGEAVVRAWLAETSPEFPVLKHPVALRLLMGHLSTPQDMRAMLETHLDALAARRADLQAVRDMLADREEVWYPAMVADWGLAYYDAETQIVTSLLDRAGPPAGGAGAGLEPDADG